MENLFNRKIDNRFANHIFLIFVRICAVSIAIFLAFVLVHFVWGVDVETTQSPSKSATKNAASLCSAFGGYNDIRYKAVYNSKKESIVSEHYSFTCLNSSVSIKISQRLPEE